MFVVVVNIMSFGVYLVVIDTVDLDPAVTCRSLVSFEAFLFLLLLVNLCLSQLRFGLRLNLVATVTTMALRNLTIAATVTESAALAAVSAASRRLTKVLTEESTAPAAAPARTAPLSGLSSRDSKDCESRENFHDTYIICISLGFKPGYLCLNSNCNVIQFYS